MSLVCAACTAPSVSDESAATQSSTSVPATETSASSTSLAETSSPPVEAIGIAQTVELLGDVPSLRLVSVDAGNQGAAPWTTASTDQSAMVAELGIEQREIVHLALTNNAAAVATTAPRSTVVGRVATGTWADRAERSTGDLFDTVEFGDQRDPDRTSIVRNAGQPGRLSVLDGGLLWDVAFTPEGPKSSSPYGALAERVDLVAGWNDAELERGVSATEFTTRWCGRDCDQEDVRTLVNDQLMPALPFPVLTQAYVDRGDGRYTVITEQTSNEAATANFRNLQLLYGAAATLPYRFDMLASSSIELIDASVDGPFAVFEFNELEPGGIDELRSSNAFVYRESPPASCEADDEGDHLDTWAVGETKNFEILRSRVTPDTFFRFGRSVTPLSVTLLSASPEEYVFQWSTGNAELPTLGVPEPLLDLTPEPDQLSGFTFDYAFNRNTWEVALTNPDEVRAQLAQLPLFDSWAPANLSDEFINAVLATDVRLFHTLDDEIELIPGEIFAEETSLPNVFGGPDFPAQITYRTDRVADSLGCLNVYITARPEPDAFLDSVQQATGIQLDELSADGVTELRSYSIRTEFQGRVNPISGAPANLREVRELNLVNGVTIFVIEIRRAENP